MQPVRTYAVIVFGTLVGTVAFGQLPSGVSATMLSDNSAASKSTEDDKRLRLLYLRCFVNEPAPAEFFKRLQAIAPEVKNTPFEGPVLLEMAKARMNDGKTDESIQLLNQVMALKDGKPFYDPLMWKGDANAVQIDFAQRLEEHFNKNPRSLSDDAFLELAGADRKDKAKCRDLLIILANKYPAGNFVKEDAAMFASLRKEAQTKLSENDRSNLEDLIDQSLRPDFAAALGLFTMNETLNFMNPDQRLSDFKRLLFVYRPLMTPDQKKEVAKKCVDFIDSLPADTKAQLGELKQACSDAQVEANEGTPSKGQ